MHLGKLCKYAGKCPVYKKEVTIKDKPIYIIRNVFCNRGQKGWQNCARYLSYESGNELSPDITPYG